LDLNKFKQVKAYAVAISLADLAETNLQLSLRRLLPMSALHGIPAKVGSEKVIAVGIDMSDLGYSLGANVEGLFLQHAADDNDSFDPVFIAGLPTTP